MIPYIICFVVSCLLTKVASNCRYENKKAFYICSILAIVIPCFLAGARDSSIGTDVNLYGIRAFYDFQYISFKEIFDYQLISEPLYKLIVFAITRFTDSQFWLLFILQLLVVGFVYVALFSQEKSDFAWIGMAIYFLLFYSFSLNLMRQMMSMSILLYAFRYIRSKKFMRYLIFCIISGLLQFTSFIGITFYFIYWVIGNRGAYQIKNKFLKKFFNKFGVIFEILIIGGFCFVVYKFDDIVNLAVQLTGKYVYQQMHIVGNISFVYQYVLLMLPFLVIFLINYKKGVELNEGYKCLFLFFLCSLVLYQTKSLSRESYRISLYFSYFLILMIPEIIEVIEHRYIRVVAGLVILLTSTVYSWYYFIYLLYNLTYPYTSELLGSF